MLEDDYPEQDNDPETEDYVTPGLTKKITTAWKDSTDGLLSEIVMLDGMNETGVDIVSTVVCCK